MLAMVSSHSTSRGFTLVEALVALAVSALLAASVAAWLGSATRSTTTVTESSEQTGIPRELQQLLREVSGASRFTSASPTSFTVVTVNAAGDGSQETYQTVTYEARQDGVYRRVGTLYPEKLSTASVTFEYYRLDGSPWPPSGNPAEIARLVVRAGANERARYAAASVAVGTGGGQDSSQIARQIPSAQQATSKEGWYTFDLCSTCDGGFGGGPTDYYCVILPGGGNGGCDLFWRDLYQNRQWPKWYYYWQGLYGTVATLGEVWYSCKNQQGAWAPQARTRHPRQYLTGYFMQIVWNYGVANCGWANW
jgi:prepilin-type N-terminal cleavage/methylation domain-containing protein